MILVESICLLICILVTSITISITLHKQTRDKYSDDVEYLTNIIARMQETITRRDNKETMLHLIGKYTLETKHTKPTEHDIYTLAVQIGAYYPEVIVAQAIQESGCGKSDVGKHAHNLFGMIKISENGRHRPTTQIPGIKYHNFGVYQNWQLSVIDRVLWDMYIFNSKPSSREEYIQRVSNIYCKGNQTYADKINDVSVCWLKKN